MKLKQNRYTCSALTLCIAALFSPATHADGFVPEVQDGISFVGLGVGVVPDYSGSADQTAGIAPYGRYLFSGQRYVQLLGTELTVNLLDNQRWRVGPLLRYRFSRNDDVDDEVVKQMRPISDTTEAGLFIAYKMPLSANPLHQLSFTADVAADTGDTYDGVTGSVRVNYFHPFTERLLGNIGLGVAYGSNGFVETYYGVTGSDIALFPSLHGKPYKPSGGVTGVRIPFGLTTPLSRQWMLSGGGRYERLVGDVEDSPVVEDRGNANQWIFGVGAAYLF
jgi:outer membrane scaffolding protein for murein synthesis (MipA/OmpV family)